VAKILGAVCVLFLLLTSSPQKKPMAKYKAVEGRARGKPSFLVIDHLEKVRVAFARSESHPRKEAFEATTYTSPWSSMALATLRKLVMFAPWTRLPGVP
jgi:hypothetical protein